jgi:dihydrofolate reductase
VVSIVVAHSSNGVIGRDNALPWHLPGDLRRFRELTAGRAVVMGRRTFESLPDAFRPLPGRRNLVLSRSYGYEPEGAEVFQTLEDALAACGHDCFVIGGEVTYRQALPVAERVYATRIDAAYEGDAHFPRLAERDWRCVEVSEPMAENENSYTFCTYERVR